MPRETLDSFTPECDTTCECTPSKVLCSVQDPIWWRFLVESDIALGQLHSTLQIVMGWTNSHLHQFIFQKRKQADRAKLGDLIDWPGTKLLYEYDFGDGWQHELVLQEILNADEPFQHKCLAGSPALSAGGLRRSVRLSRAS